jgi:methyl-accepting chemotaxis protein
MDSEHASDFEQEVYGILKAFQSNHSGVKNASVGVEANGGFVKYPPTPRFDGYDARERDWYKKALNRPNEVVISGIYKTSSDEDVILCVKSIYDDRGDLKGVVTVDFDLRNLSVVIDHTQIGSSGYTLVHVPFHMLFVSQMLFVLLFSVDF